MPHTCNECRFAIFADYGYSNYTTDGTYFRCAKRLHPNGEFDRFYGEDKRLDFAQTCPGFEAGEGVQLDCDLEEEKDGDLSAYTKDTEVATLLNAWRSAS